MAVIVYSLTEAGSRLGERIANTLSDASGPVEHKHKVKPFIESVQADFAHGHRLIMICATGIAVRALAPVIQSKLTDPAVLVLDELGQFIIPLLSGHEGGANEFGRVVADLLDGQLVQTTANPYLKPVYVAGVGCERDCPQSYIEEIVHEALAQKGLELSDIAGISSIDIKVDETHLIAFAEQQNKPFVCYPKEALAEFESQLSQKSDYVFKTVGVYGVAESAALAGAKALTGEQPELVVNKIKNAKATCAIARSYPIQESQKVVPL